MVDPNVAAVIIGLASLVMSVVATGAVLWGLNQWKKEREYDAHFDLARRFLLIVSKFNHEFSLAQTPFGPSPSEYKDRPKKEHENEKQATMLDDQYAYMKRLQPLNVLIQEMWALNWEANATLGIDFQIEIDRYLTALHRIKLAIWHVCSYELEKGIQAGIDAERRINEREREWEIIYGRGLGAVLRKEVEEITEEAGQRLIKYTFAKRYGKKRLQLSYDERMESLRLRDKELEEKLVNTAPISD